MCDRKKLLSCFKTLNLHETQATLDALTRLCLFLLQKAVVAINGEFKETQEKVVRCYRGITKVSDLYLLYKILKYTLNVRQVHRHASSAISRNTFFKFRKEHLFLFINFPVSDKFL